jgi:hypothetical protein
MKKSKFSEEPVAYAIRQSESRTAVADICRRTGIRGGTVKGIQRVVKR